MRSKENTKTKVMSADDYIHKDRIRDKKKEYIKRLNYLSSKNDITRREESELQQLIGKIEVLNELLEEVISLNELRKRLEKNPIANLIMRKLLNSEEKFEIKHGNTKPIKYK